MCVVLSFCFCTSIQLLVCQTNCSKFHSIQLHAIGAVGFHLFCPHAMCIFQVRRVVAKNRAANWWIVLYFWYVVDAILVICFRSFGVHKLNVVNAYHLTDTGGYEDAVIRKEKYRMVHLVFYLEFYRLTLKLLRALRNVYWILFKSLVWCTCHTCPNRLLSIWVILEVSNAVYQQRECPIRQSQFSVKWSMTLISLSSVFDFNSSSETFVWIIPSTLNSINLEDMSKFAYRVFGWKIEKYNYCLLSCTNWVYVIWQ